MATEDHVPGLDMAIPETGKTIPPEEQPAPPSSWNALKAKMLTVIERQRNLEPDDHQSFVLDGLNDHQLLLVATFVESFYE